MRQDPLERLGRGQCGGRGTEAQQVRYRPRYRKNHTDIGKTWLRVDDDSHQYGGLGNGYFVKGDMNVFGRVYRSSPGRGIPFGTPAN